MSEHPMDEKAPASEQIFDLLFDCLERVGAWHGVDINRQVLLSGLPVGETGRLTPELLLRAAHRAGFHGEVVKRKLSRIPQAVLPAIVLLEGGRAGVLMPVAGDDESSHVEFRLAGSDRDAVTAADVLREAYSGYAILMRLESSPSSRMSGFAADERSRRSGWFWRTMWQFRADYLRLLPASLLVNVFALALPVFTMLVYDRVVPNDATETLFVLASGITIVFAFEFFLRLLRGRVIERGGREMDMVLASELFDQILALEMRARPASSGALAGRAKGYETLREFFISAALLALVDVPFALMMSAMIFWIGGPVGWVVVVAVVLVLLIEAMMQAPLRRFVMESTESGVERQAFMGETINAMESVKAANAESALQHRFETMVAFSSRKDGRSHWYSLLGSSTTKALINVTSVAVVVAAVFEIHDGSMTMGGMIACIMLAARCMTPLAMAAGLMTRLQQTLQSLKGLNAVMALPRETGADRKFINHRPAHLNYRLQGVSVSYSGQMVPALKDVSLTIQEGERIALLGRMGSGKSTLLRVLAKLYAPTAGQALLDGIDLAQYHPAVVRAEVGYLPQDGTIFCGSLRENIALGMERASDEQIMEAVRMAGLEDLVAGNPLGLHAPVGERGCLLSGGQRHAVVLARTLLRRPKLLLLDEPASSMDLQAEQQFLSSLKAYLDADPRRSLVIASHKSSTLALVSRVIVLHEGRIYRDGAIADVMKDLARSSSQRPAAARAPAAAVVAASVPTPSST